MALSASDIRSADAWLTKYGDAKATESCARGFKGKRGADRKFPEWCARWNKPWNVPATSTPATNTPTAAPPPGPSSDTPVVHSYDFIPVGADTSVEGSTPGSGDLIGALLESAKGTVHEETIAGDRNAVGTATENADRVNPTAPKTEAPKTGTSWGKVALIGGGLVAVFSFFKRRRRR